MLNSQVTLAGKMNGQKMGKGKPVIRNGLPDVIERYRARREAEEHARGNENFKLTLTTVREEINERYGQGISYPALYNWAKKEVFSADLRLVALFCDYFGVGVEDILVLSRED